MHRITARIALLVGCALAATGCGELGKKGATQTIASDDGVCQVTVPASWARKPDLNDGAVLQVANLRREAYLIVLTDAKSDLENFDLAHYAEVVRTEFLQGTGGTAGPEQQLTINGRPALRYDIEATVNDVKVIYWHTCVEGTDHFHQVLMWTLPSKLKANKEAFEAALQSFNET